MTPFEGEHLLPGQIGQFLVITAWICGILGTISFFKSASQKEGIDQTDWFNYGRLMFAIQTISILGIFTIIFYICSNHYYEYMYAYKHASKELEYKYLLACIWEGQEGSFLLWTIWHAVLGWMILWKSRSEWKFPVMGIISLAQFFLLFMILGIYVGEIRLGNSPFVLTRNEIPAPIFSQPNYLTFLKDGMGLNVLLRNYWMVIHPPILFLGFASTIVPFAIAVSALIKRKFAEYLPAALPWALFGTAVLGVGIMMGGKWAYESLSFGGYWAWDPVENASLVPWLILVAGLHTLLIFKATGRSLQTTILFFILSFCFVLYSTFLTRTGILGDTSVHAFTEAGKAINIMIGIFVLSFFIPSIALFFLRYKKIPVILQEEAISSREFWMFIGSLLLFLSSIFIILITSIPVYAKTPLLSSLILKIHGGPLAMPEDAEFLYNKVMILASIIITSITAVAQYLKYKETKHVWVKQKLIYPTFIALLITILIAFVYPFTFVKHGTGFLAAIYLAFFAAVYSAISNGMFISLSLKNNWKKAGGSLSHVGFALMIAGMIISSANKKVLSDANANGIILPASQDPMTKKTDNPSDNLTLIRNVPVKLGNYIATYIHDSAGMEKGRKFYTIVFESKDSITNKASFTLQPDVYVMKDNNMSSNPDTKIYLTKDIFTYLSFVSNPEQKEDTAQFRERVTQKGDTLYYKNGFIHVDSIIQVKQSDPPRIILDKNDVALRAYFTLTDRQGLHYKSNAAIKANDQGVKYIDDTVYAQNLFIRFAGVADSGKVRISIKETDKPIDFITIKCYEFPYISLVWLGLIIMAIGIFMSLSERLKLSNLARSVILILILIGLTYMFLLPH